MILEEINASGGNAGRLPRADVHDGHAPAARQRGAEGSATCRRSPPASCGCRRSASPSRPPAPTRRRSRRRAERVGGGYVIRGQKIWTSRAEHSDLMLLLARTTPARAGARSKTDGLSVFLVDMRGGRRRGSTIRPIRTMMNHATTEVFFDGVEVPADALIGEEGKGFRYILDGMNAERILIAAECIGDGRWFIEKAARYASRAGRVRPADRREPGRAVPDRAGATRRSRRPTWCAARGRRLFDARRAVRRRGEHGEAARLRGVVGRRRTRASTRTAATASPPSTTSSASSARRASTRSRRSRTTSCSPIVGQHVLGMPRSY